MSRFLFVIYAACTGKVARLLASAASDIRNAALSLSNSPETTTAKADWCTSSDLGAVSAALDLNENLLYAFIEISTAINVLKQLSPAPDLSLASGYVNRPDHNQRENSKHLLLSGISFSLFLIGKACWEDLALPHRKLNPLSRKFLKRARKKLVFSKQICLWLQ